MLTLRTELPRPRYASTAVRARFYRQVLAGVRALPGVHQAAFTSFLPMVMGGGIWPVLLDGETVAADSSSRMASLRFVTPGYFETLGIPLRSGRDIRESDSIDGTAVAVVSESFARSCWPGRDALGRSFQVPFGENAVNSFVVVGIAGDVRVRGLERGSEPQMYLSYQQVADGAVPWYSPKDLAIRASTPPATLLPAVRRIIAAADPQQPIAAVQTLAEVVADETAPRALQARVLAMFAAVAFLLAGIGLHGLLAFTVSARADEIALRRALGADTREVLRLVLGRALAMAAVGAALGAVLAYAAGSTLQALLAGVSPHDPLAFAAAIALAAAMTLAGSLTPALRAVRLDPQSVLRAE